VKKTAVASARTSSRGVIRRFVAVVKAQMLDALHPHRGEERAVYIPHLIGVAGSQRRDHQFAGTDPFSDVAQNDFRVLSVFGAADGDQ